ncbi:MAG: DUF5791 family protein [Halodesulfurarchaeum sp.]
MNRPPLARFLDDSVSRAADGRDGTGAVTATYEELLSVLAAVVTTRGVESVATETGLDRELLAFVVGESGVGTGKSERMRTLETVAAILATESRFSASEVRARLGDHLIVQMSRDPIDAESLAVTYGFGDATELRAKIEGDRPLTLREYARLRVALDP